mmetsp:Transcript_14013/g.20192  ORF Transcript_14013/g.20192 Transcript_14013/m.20192 type:complete len:128 (+) Transcript_14013:1-384(+)
MPLPSPLQQQQQQLQPKKGTQQKNHHNDNSNHTHPPFFLTIDDSDEQIATVYCASNEKCRKQAQALALYDEEEAKRLNSGMPSLTTIHFNRGNPNDQHQHHNHHFKKHFHETGKQRLNRLFKGKHGK